MFMFARLVFAGLVCLVAVGAAAAQRALPGAQVSVTSEVYAVLVSGAYHHGLSGSRMLVRDELIPIRALSAETVPAFLKEFDPVPVELRAALRRPAIKPAPLDRALFPAGTRFISQASIAAAFTQGPGKDWPAFKRQYTSDGWVSFSDVVVTADGLDALVYTEAHCGDLCGQGSYIWLQRTGSTAPWSIKKTIVSWIS
jgi:hypothetical protein